MRTRAQQTMVAAVLMPRAAIVLVGLPARVKPATKETALHARVSHFQRILHCVA